MHLFTLRTLLNAIIRCLQLNTNGELGMTTWRWIISHRCSWMTVYVSCRNAQIKYHSDHHAMYLHCHALTICQLPSCNLFTQHVRYLYGETPLVNCGPRSNSFTLIKPQTANCSFFIRCNLILIFHTRRLILCFQQAGEIDNLTVSLGQSTVIVLCAGSTLVIVLRRASRQQRSEESLLLLVR